MTLSFRMLLAAALLAGTPMFAQIQSGRIVGTVYDPNRAVVPNAKVVVTNTATNQPRTLMTSATGDFVLTPVDPGMYRVEVTAAGFLALIDRRADAPTNCPTASAPSALQAGPSATGKSS